MYVCGRKKNGSSQSLRCYGSYSNSGWTSNLVKRWEKVILGHYKLFLTELTLSGILNRNFDLVFAR